MAGGAHRADRLWQRARQQARLGHQEAALALLARIRRGAQSAGGLPYDLLVPWQRYRWGQIRAAALLLRCLQKRRYPVLLRLELARRLQRDGLWRLQARDVARRIRQESRPWRDVLLPPRRKWRAYSWRQRKGYLFRHKEGKTVWFSRRLLVEELGRTLKESPLPAGWSVRFAGVGKPSWQSGPLAVWLEQSPVPGWGWTLAMSGAVLALAGLMGLGAAALRRAVQQEIALRQERQRFASAVSHELRTPLTSLSMTAELLASGEIPPSKQQRLFERLDRELQRLRRLVEHVLLFYRSGAVQEKEAVSLVDVAKEATSTMEPLAVGAGNCLVLCLPDEEVPPLWGDGVALCRALQNLLDNAIRYAPGTKVTITVRSEPSLEVCDEGPGLDAGEIELLFRPFVRGQSASGTGAGLGLSLVQEVVSVMGGTIEASNAPQGGARFFLCWPKEKR